MRIHKRMILCDRKIVQVSDGDATGFGGVKTGMFRRKPKHVSSTFFTSSTKVMKKHLQCKASNPELHHVTSGALLFFYFSLLYFIEGQQPIAGKPSIRRLPHSVDFERLRDCRATLKSSAGRSVAARLARNAPLRESKNYRGQTGVAEDECLCPGLKYETQTLCRNEKIYQ